MAEYNVDDILAEIERDRKMREVKENRRSQSTVPPAAHVSASAASANYEPDTEHELEKKRQAHVSDFMQASFAAEEKDADNSDENSNEDELIDPFELFSHLDGGLHREEKTGSLFAPDDSETDSDDGKFAGLLENFALGGGEKKKHHEAKQHKDTPRTEKRQTAKKMHVEKPRRERKKPEPENTAREYRTPFEASEIRGELAATHKNIFIRLIITGICFLIDFYLSLCNLFALPLLSVVCPENNMQLYILCCFLPFFISVLLSLPVLINGLPSLCARRADHDTPAALCVVAVVIHTSALCAGAGLSLQSGKIYTAVGCMVLFMNTLGKFTMICRIERNFAVVSSDSPLCAEQFLDDVSMSSKLTGISPEDEPQVVYPVRTAFGEKFLELSFSTDDSERMCGITSPIFAIFGIIVAILCKLIFRQSGVDSLGVFCIMLCMSCALSQTLVCNLPLWRAAKLLTPHGAFIAGSASGDMLGYADAVGINASEIYPAGTAKLQGIKVLQRDRINDAILDSASVFYAADGIPGDVFLEMVGGNTGMLLPVENIKYESGGISATVGGHEVLLGNRELLSAHGVHIPSIDFESRYVKPGIDWFYLAQDGSAIAMLLFTYRANADTAYRLKRLAANGIGLIIATGDPNITSSRIERDYDYPAELVRIVPPALGDTWQNLTAPRDSAPAYAMSIVGGQIRLQLLCALHTLEAAVRLGTLIQTAGLVMGYALAALLAFFGSAGSLGFAQVLAYQLFWCAATLATNLLIRL